MEWATPEPSSFLSMRMMRSFFTTSMRCSAQYSWVRNISFSLVISPCSHSFDRAGRW
ncbi:hypothetical protein SHIRM173S_08417 [Streptomyces hirsutus]